MPIKKDKLTVGCIGCGNMGGAILQGLSKFTKYKLVGSDPNVACLDAIQPDGAIVATSIPQLVNSSDIIIIAVKPGLMKTVTSKMLPDLTKNKVVVSVAAGVTVKELHELLESKCPVVRCMPNISANVGGGVFAFCSDDVSLPQKKKELVLDLFKNIGTCIELPEHNFTAFSALIGAGPGYILHLVNALVQAGVTLGFSRKDAKIMVEALCAGTVRMSQESNFGLLELRDQVCSPGGLTIQGINHMERMGVSGHIVDSILAADKRAREMEKK